MMKSSKTKAAATTRKMEGDSEYEHSEDDLGSQDKVSEDKRDLDWATVLKRTFESYIRGEQPNMYGEWIQW